MDQTLRTMDLLMILPLLLLSVGIKLSSLLPLLLSAVQEKSLSDRLGTNLLKQLVEQIKLILTNASYQTKDSVTFANCPVVTQIIIDICTL
mmetsp:Transcript_28362/g.32408  ORF Transcript_28362/g.32408 Transcript_28362/m.32408 type:complete len:91 (+) Transcript_28362:1465-1737(+)